MSNPITIDSEILSGEPVLAGTLVPIRAFFDYVEDGMSVTEFIDNYPCVDLAMIHDARAMRFDHFAASQISKSHFPTR